MTSTLMAQPATAEDAGEIARIYNQGIEDRNATFETEPRAAESVRGWFDGKAPIVVVLDGQSVIGFAASFLWRSRPWFSGILELAVYVDRAHRGRGAGRLALDGLVQAATAAGFWKLLGALFTSNPGSRALMRQAGFREVGTYESQAQLDSEWKDVLLVEKLIAQNVLPRTVIFACVHNAGRSQMAAAFFNQLADPAKARAFSAGTTPGEQVHPEVVEVMREAGVDLSRARPQKLTPELARGAHLLVTMGCGDECPVVPGAKRDDWPLPDPKGKPLDEVRRIRDEIRRRLAGLVAAEGWTRD
jgi:arsenate reductase